jgi:glycosyltransferase involved in cell wall biosynthesis
MKVMRKRILYIVQLPPPLHGATIVNKLIVESQAIQKAYITKTLPLRFVKEVNEIGRFSMKKVFIMFVFLFRLIGQLIIYRPHLVYFTISPKGFAFYRDALYVFFIKLFRRKIVFHLHSRGIQEALERISRLERIYRFVFRNTSVIFLSESLIHDSQGLPVKEVLLLPNGIPDHSYCHANRLHSVPVILFLSNLFVEKGVLIFIDVIEKLAQRGHLFKARIVGADGNVTTKDIKKIIADKNLSRFAEVYGPQYGEGKYIAFEEASVFCMPSMDEAFPLVILEAMQASLGIVASRVGAIPDMIKDGVSGYLCPAGDAGVFADRIAALLENPELRKQLSEQAQKDFESKFRLSVFDSSIKGIIDHLLKDKN